MVRYALFSNDVETHSIWFNDLRDDTGKLVLEKGLPKLLSLYQELNINSTFFITGYYASKFPEAIKLILGHGNHEIGCHGLYHNKEFGFDVMNYDMQVQHLKEAKNRIEQIYGKEIISFRAPALRVKPETALALKETGFKIDSSIASQRFDLFLSFGGVQKLKWVTCPRLPYITKEDNLFKKGTKGVIEIPISAIGFPYIGTTMRIFPNITKLFRSLLVLENYFNKKPIVFDIHPNEFIDESEQKREILNRSSNFVAYFLQDYLRGKLKVKNLGKNGLEIYKKELLSIINKGFTFMTIKDYAIKQELLDENCNIING